MSNRILVQPAEDYFVAFLATRGVRISAEQPNVIHYFGDSKHKLKRLVSKHNPDLIILHNKKVFSIDYPFSFALDRIENDKDIHVNRNIITNAFELTRLYYIGLGLERTIIDCSDTKKKKDKQKLKISLSVVRKFFATMMWD